MKNLASLFLGNPAWLRDILQLAFLVGVVFELGRNTPLLVWRLLVAAGRAIRQWSFE